MTSTTIAREIVQSVTGIPLPPQDYAGESHPAAQQLLADVRAYRRNHDEISAELADELIQVLGEASTEIVNFYGPGNVVAWRLVELRKRVEEARAT